MGLDYGCGCRTSGGQWWLCEKHETMMFYITEFENEKSKSHDNLREKQNFLSLIRDALSECFKCYKPLKHYESQTKKEIQNWWIKNQK